MEYHMIHIHLYRIAFNKKNMAFSTRNSVIFSFCIACDTILYICFVCFLLLSRNFLSHKRLWNMPLKQYQQIEIGLATFVKNMFQKDYKYMWTLGFRIVTLYKIILKSHSWKICFL